MKRIVHRIGAYILFVALFFSVAVPCRAAQIRSDEAADSGVERPFITSVSVSPGTAVVSRDAKCSFTSYVAGVNDYSREVVWSVSGQTSQSTFIDTNGVLNVASDEKAPSIVVKAVSRQDSNYSATALVFVQADTYYVRVEASPEKGGAVKGSGTVNAGDDAVISAWPSDGFTFEGWTLNGNRVSQDLQYTVTDIRGDVTYVAEFKQITCQVTVNVNDTAAGTATESRTVNYGEGMTLEAWAKEGYQFEGWTENGNTVSKDSRMQLDNIRDSRTVTAVFAKKNEKPKTYTITASASSENGTITPAGRSTVKEGEGILYTMTPKSGYAVSSVYVDGKAVGWMNSFHFTDVRENHTISVDFAEAPEKDKNSASVEKPAPPENKTDQRTDTAEQDKKEEEDKPDQDIGTEKTKDKEVEESDTGKTQESEATGILKHLNVSVEEAERLVKGNNDAELMSGALETGDLRITIHNDFADTAQEVSYYNFEAVVDSFLDGEEKMELLLGNAPVAIDLYIRDSDGKETAQIQKDFAENKLPGMNVGQYFEVVLTAEKQGETQTISELPTALKVVMDVPGRLKAEKRQFYVLRLHTKEDGSREFAQLADEDDNPDTITFTTDKFSPYAIAYIDWNAADGPTEEKSRGMRNAAGIAVVLLAAAATVTGLLYIAGKKKR